MSPNKSLKDLPLFAGIEEDGSKSNTVEEAIDKSRNNVSRFIEYYIKTGNTLNNYNLRQLLEQELEGFKKYIFNYLKFDKDSEEAKHYLYTTFESYLRREGYNGDLGHLQVYNEKLIQDIILEGDKIADEDYKLRTRQCKVNNPSSDTKKKETKQSSRYQRDFMVFKSSCGLYDSYRLKIGSDGKINRILFAFKGQKFMVEVNSYEYIIASHSDFNDDNHYKCVSISDIKIGGLFKKVRVGYDTRKTFNYFYNLGMNFLSGLDFVKMILHDYHLKIDNKK